MTKLSKTFVQLSMAMIVGAAALIWSGQSPLDRSAALVSSAEARIGRPLTPMRLSLLGPDNGARFPALRSARWIKPTTSF
jgi:hypothetical protein